MARKNWRKKKRPAQNSVPNPATLSWVFDASIPTESFFENRNLEGMWDRQEAVENFIYRLETGRFLMWEAVVCHERNLPLTARQMDAVADLVNFGDPDDDQIHYIDERPRPSEPWYVILNKIVPHLLIEPFRTFDIHEEVRYDGWKQILTALKEHGSDLSLPPGITSYREVVPPDLRHKLWLQTCFTVLGGLGQDEELTLQEPEQHWRIDEFIEVLRQQKESVIHFDLTLESLCTRVILPERDRPIFVTMMQKRLGLKSVQEPLGDRL